MNSVVGGLASGAVLGRIQGWSLYSTVICWLIFLFILNIFQWLASAVFLKSNLTVVLNSSLSLWIWSLQYTKQAYISEKLKFMISHILADKDAYYITLRTEAQGNVRLWSVMCVLVELVQMLRRLVLCQLAASEIRHDQNNFLPHDLV